MSLKEKFGKALQKVFDAGATASGKLSDAAFATIEDAYETGEGWAPESYTDLKADFKSKALMAASRAVYAVTAKPAEIAAKAIRYDLNPAAAY
jgi:hypothetical protein